MGTIIKTVQVDDLTGEESDEVYTYSFDANGKVYQIDLTPENGEALTQIVADFDEAIAPYVEAGTVKGSKRRGRKAAAKTASGRDDLAEIRAWAAKAGHDVAAKGRVPVAVIQAYDAAH